MTGGNLLLNADDGPGGVDATVSITSEALGDGILDPGESFTVDFEIGLAQLAPFTFYVDAYGIVVDGVSSGSVSGDNSRFRFEVDEEQLQDSRQHMLYLPTVVDQ